MKYPCIASRFSIFQDLRLLFRFHPFRHDSYIDAMGNTAQRSDIEPAVVLLVLKLTRIGAVNLDILRMKRLQIPQPREALTIVVKSNTMPALSYCGAELFDQSQVLDSGKLGEFKVDAGGFKGKSSSEIRVPID